MDSSAEQANSNGGLAGPVGRIEILSQQDALKKQLMDQMYEMQEAKRRIMMDTQAGYANIGEKSKSPGYQLTIQPAVNGGFAVFLDGELFVASRTEDLPSVIIAAIGRKKIKA